MVHKKEYIILDYYRRWVILTLLFLLFLPVVFVYAQDLSYRQFTIEDGLPSNQIYDVHQDPDGFIWFATENGLSRYNGEEFINYTLFDGLPDTEIVGFFQDSKNRLWFRSLNGKLGFYKNGIFHNEDNTHFLKDAFLQNTIRNIVEDGLGNVYFSYYRLILKLTPQNELIKIDAPAHTGIVVDKKGQIYIAQKNPKDSLNFIKIPEMTLASLKSLDLDNKNKYNLFHSKLTDFSKVHPVSLSFRRSFQPNKNVFILQKENAYWVSSPLAPLQILEANEKEFLEVTNSIDKLSITRGIVDQEKYVWYGSLGKGVFRFDKSNALFYRLGEHFEGELLSSLFIDKDNKQIYCGTSDGILNIIANDTIQSKKIEYPSTGTIRIRDIEKDKFGRIWLVCDLFILVYDATTLQFENPFKVNESIAAPKDIMFDTITNQLFIANNICTFKYDYPSHQIINEKLLLRKRSTCIHIDAKGQLWSGTSKGLYYFPKHSDYNKSISIDVDDPISCINHLGNTIIAGTKGKGLIVINGDSIRRITTDLGLPSNLIRSIYVAEDESIWVATNEGLCKMQDIHQSNLSIRVINEQNGLISNDVIDCGMIDSTLYVLCSQGLSVLELSEINDNLVPPNLYMEQIIVNNQVMSFDSIQQLAHDQNNISFHFSGIHFGNRSKLEYIYKLNGYHDSWQKTKNQNLVFEQLLPRKYTLELYATMGDKKSASKIIKFNIIPAFHQRRMVQLFGLCLMTLGIFYFIRYILKREKEKAIIDKRLIQLEQVALQSQMNPHFIKNSLGAIQHLMIKKDVRTANKYLIVFGELITQLLQQSDQSQIKILDEIRILKLYLNIEKLRFDNNFDYKIICDDKEILDYKIPSMMIQPLVENAIIHGFRDMAKHRNNAITIHLYPKNDYLICTVEDNGLGIRPASNTQSIVSKRHGIAMKNIKERISLLAIKNPKTDFNIIKTDSTGTIIKLCLPLSENYD